MQPRLPVKAAIHIEGSGYRTEEEVCQKRLRFPVEKDSKTAPSRSRPSGWGTYGKAATYKVARALRSNCLFRLYRLACRTAGTRRNFPGRLPTLVHKTSHSLR